MIDHPVWFLLALLDFVSRATVMAQASVVRPQTLVSRKPLHGSRPNFVGGSLSITWPNFFFSKFPIFIFLRFFFSFSLTWGPMGAKMSKRLSSSRFYPI